MSTARRAVTRFRQLDGTDTDGDVDPGDVAAEASSVASSNAPLHLRNRSLDKARRFSDHEEHLYFWMPLLIGLTELTFDPRPTVRRSALDVLFDILHEHGACYSKGFWAKVFERMLLPIFDSVQVEDIDLATFVSPEAANEEAERDRWLYETCSHCLHHLIYLIVKFYPLVNQQLPKVLLKIKAFMLRTHHSLACVGVTAMERLITESGPFMDRDMWDAAMASIVEVARETVPDLSRVVSYPESRYQRNAGDSGMIPAPAVKRGCTTDVHSCNMHCEDDEWVDAGDEAKAEYSLAEGLGSRRLKQVTVRAHVQSLLVQSCVSIYDHQHESMPVSAVKLIVEATRHICHHARLVRPLSSYINSLLPYGIGKATPDASAVGQM